MRVKRSQLVMLAVGVLVAVCFRLFIGYEQIDRHDSDVSEFFVKKYPSFQFVYRNPVHCGECDVEPLEDLTPPELKEFERFCRARHGLNDVAACYKIYDDWQKQVRRNLGKSD